MPFRHSRAKELLAKADPKRGSFRRAADALGVAPNTVSDWLRGYRQPGGQQLIDLAAYLGTTADELLPPTVRDRPAAGQ